MEFDIETLLPVPQLLPLQAFHPATRRQYRLAHRPPSQGVASVVCEHTVHHTSLATRPAFHKKSATGSVSPHAR